MRFEPLHPTFGARVVGFDPARDAEPGTAKALKRALSEHRILLFRDQELSDADFVGFCRLFGDLEILPEPEKRHPDHPEIFNLSNIRPDGTLTPRDDPQAIFLRGTSRWHTDSSFREIPCLATILYAVEVPPEGGDTEFADMIAAHDALDAAERAELERLSAVHSYAYSRSTNPGKLKPLTPEELAKVPDTTHPVIRRLPDGRRSVYLGGHVSHLADSDVEASRARVRDLEARLTAVGNVYRHAWRKGDLLLWDNRSTLHRLTGYEIDKYRRVMRRCTVAGTDPVEPAITPP
jgi:alpha-ketoglutarate-dependent taurine dioxygenase